MPRSTATTEPLTPRWLDAHRTRIDPQLAPLQRLASEAIWTWFDELGEGGQVGPHRTRTKAPLVPAIRSCGWRAVSHGAGIAVVAPLDEHRRGQGYVPIEFDEVFSMHGKPAFFSARAAA